VDLAALQALVAEGESERLEFKKSTGDLKGGLETLCAFLNGDGGRVLFGVSAAGAIRGQEISDSTLREVGNELLRLEPPAHIIMTRVSVDGSCAGWYSKRPSAAGRRTATTAGRSGASAPSRA
jgi:ATP-dependent DNA helicase RecG